MAKWKGFFTRILGRAEAKTTEKGAAFEPSGVATFVRVPSDVPSFYADSCIFIGGVGNTARLQFVEAIPGALDSTDPGLKMRYAFNVIMPHEGLMAMVRYLLSVLPEESRKEILDGF